MNYIRVFDHLEKHLGVFENLLKGLTSEEYLWKQSSDKWCLLEIACHLVDEEKEDFRTRTRYTLELPNLPPPSINPVGWVTSREYLNQDYQAKVEEFIKERKNSLEWLRSLENPDWSSSYLHPTLGSRSAHFYLANWLAHDLLHIKQIMRLKYDYLQFISNENLDYAGNWI